jgi:hypothetical protein
MEQITQPYGVFVQAFSAVALFSFLSILVGADCSRRYISIIVQSYTEFGKSPDSRLCEVAFGLAGHILRSRPAKP